MITKWIHGLSASISALAIWGWFGGPALAPLVGSVLLGRLVGVLLPLTAAAVVELIGRLCVYQVRNQVREFVQTAISHNSREALREAELRIQVAEEKWGVLDLWKEKDAIEGAKSQLLFTGRQAW